MEKLVIVIKVQAMRATFGSCRLPAALNDSQSSSHTINWSSLMMSMLWSSMSQTADFLASISKCQGLFKESVVQVNTAEASTSHHYGQPSAQ
ncbi:uncharacterized protein LOC105357979 isoform X4 [Oryzias latipes]|uniref:uncharacterized protein LOC105357979 isoform X4 n=1 Tax=Oryzias latipes TaxID=8090 RepID=UPI000CE271D8|nr:uncharacterized protein LOC105357979 isoform X4 [Oryzias latipes]